MGESFHDDDDGRSLHEIAHALAGPDSEAHGPVWRTIARRIGATPTATSTEHAVPAAPWNGECSPWCENDGKFNRFRLSQAARQRAQCPKCRATITWSRS